MKIPKSLVSVVFCPIAYLFIALALNSVFPNFFAKQTDFYSELLLDKPDFVVSNSSYFFTLLVENTFSIPFANASLIVHALFLCAFLSFSFYFLAQLPLSILSTYNPSLNISSLFTSLFCFPSFLYFSCTSLREIDLAFASCVLLMSSYLLRKRKSLLNFIIVLFSLLLVLMLRVEYAPFLLFTALLLLFLPSTRLINRSTLVFYIFNKRFWKISRSSLRPLALVLIIATIVFALFGNIIISRLYHVDSFNYDYISNFILSRHVRSADAGSNITCSHFSYVCTLLAWPFAPLPLNPFESVMFFFVFIDSLVLLKKYKIISSRFADVRSQSVLSIAIVPLLALFLVLSVFTFNIGNIFRIRASLAPLFIVFLLILSYERCFASVSAHSQNANNI